MANSILNDIKKMLGYDADYKAFDTDIIIAINTALMTLMQIGVGPRQGFHVDDETDTWFDFLGDSTEVEGVKTYIYLKTRIFFDPPANSFVMDAYKTQAQELEWRLNVMVDPPSGDAFGVPNQDVFPAIEIS